MITTALRSTHAVRDRWTRSQIIVIGLCCLINALDGMDILIVSFIAPALSADWNVSAAAIGVVFSAGFAGMMIGSLLLAPVADFIGRRPVILSGVVLLSVGMIASGFAPSLSAIALCRVIVGAGIGALLPSLAALVSEYAPPARRTMAIGIYQAGYPLGAVLTGFACIAAIPRIGWQATLVGAGCASLALLPVIWWLLPESTRSPERKSASDERSPARLGEMFVNGMWVKSVLLWLSTMLAYATLYFVTSWIPKLAMKAGLDASDALYASTIFNLGGLLGGLLMGRLAQRHRVGRVMAVFFVVSAATMLLFSIPAVLLVAFALAFLMGLTLQGGFTGYYSLSALLYPAEVRSSGIGWAVGIGRAGSIVGPLLGGFLLSHDVSLWATFLCFAVPLVIAGALAERVGRAVPPPRAAA